CRCFGCERSANCTSSSVRPNPTCLKMADEPNQIDETRLFELLDGYVAALHAGLDDQCSRWLAEHPQLRDLAHCLEALDRFSDKRADLPAGATMTFKPDLHLAPTIAPADTSFEPDAGRRAGAPAGNFGKYELLEEVGR